MLMPSGLCWRMLNEPRGEDVFLRCRAGSDQVREVEPEIPLSSASLMRYPIEFLEMVECEPGSALGPLRDCRCGQSRDENLQVIDVLGLRKQFSD
jgi:hypothetical protein